MDLTLGRFVASMILTAQPSAAWLGLREYSGRAAGPASSSSSTLPQGAAEASRRVLCAIYSLPEGTLPPELDDAIEDLLMPGYRERVMSAYLASLPTGEHLQ